MSVCNRCTRHALGLLSFIATILSACGSSPADEALIRHFQENRSSYEDLRNLLTADPTLAEVGTSGVQTLDSPQPATPPTADISAERYQQYMDLLQKADGFRVSRSPGSDPTVCIGVLARGGGGTRHDDICWHDRPPAKGVLTVRSIESGWYLEGD